MIRSRKNQPPVEAITGPRLPRRRGWHRTVVIAPKGGVGKTTVASMLALTLAEHRPEQVVLVDANIHTGSARRRLTDDADLPGSWLEFAQEVASGARFTATEMSRFVDRVGPVGRLSLVSNVGVDPAVVESMTADQYRGAVEALTDFYPLLVSDMGTSIAGPVAIEALSSADQLVAVTEMSKESLEECMEHLSALAGEPLSYRPDPPEYGAITDGRFAHLLPSAVVVVNPPKGLAGGGRRAPDFTPYLDWLRSVAGHVVVVPADPHISTGQIIDLGRVSGPVRRAHAEVAAAVAAGFPSAGANDGAQETDAAPAALKPAEWGGVA